MNPKKMFFLGSIAVAAVICIMFIGKLVENLAAKDILVVQHITGAISIHKSPGPKLQLLGEISTYSMRGQFWFSTENDQGKEEDQSIRVQFNDGGTGRISGSISWEMPLADQDIYALHRKYGSQEAIEHQLIRTVLEKAVYFAGPLMSSRESYAERKNQLINFIEDQATHGVYRTVTRQIRVLDPMKPGVWKTDNVVELVRDSHGLPLRSDRSPLNVFKVKVYNLSINRIVYDEKVQKQIDDQQKLYMAIQTSRAEAQKSEQMAITAEQNGKASAAKAKWDQETLNAKLIAEAEQKKTVAELAMQTAEFWKKEQVLRGEGEAERKRLVMNADGALDKKLDAYVKVQGLYADAIKGYQGQWVPGVVMGGSSGGNGALNLMEIFAAKAARDLAVDLQASGQGKTSGK